MGCVRTEDRGNKQNALAASRPNLFCLLGHLHQGLQSHQSLAKHLASLLQGNRLFYGRTNPEKLTHFIKGPTEARCRWKASKPTHGVVALFNTTVVLLQPIIQLHIGPVYHVITKDLADRTRIGIMPIGCYPLWRVVNHGHSLTEELFCSLHIAFLAET